MPPGAKHYRKRGKPSARPPVDELAQMGLTMTADEIANARGVHLTTAQNWLRECGIAPRRRSISLRRKNQDMLFRRFGNNFEAVRAYLVARTLEEVIEDMGATLSSVYKWERAHGVRCKRRCTDCRQVFEFTEMTTRRDGRPCSRCTSCADQTVGKPIRPQPSVSAASVDIGQIPVPEVSRRWSRCEGINGWLRPQVAFG